MLCTDCSDEYGPCENHGNVLAQREGASSRTADELAHVYMLDVLAILEQDAPTFNRTELQKTADYYDDESLWSGDHGTGWLEDPDESQWLYESADAFEHAVHEATGAYTFWEDGYVIVIPSPEYADAS